MSHLDRLEKLANIAIPVVIAVIGGIYTYVKDKADTRAQTQAAQYSNFSALLPLLLSKDGNTAQLAVEIYTVEAHMNQAPPGLSPVVKQVATTQPQLLEQVQQAIQAVSVQNSSACGSFPKGLFLEVANDADQLKNGQTLADQLRKLSDLPTVQSVQRVDAAPRKTQLRYYYDRIPSTTGNDKQAERIIDELKTFGITSVDLHDLDGSYLKNTTCAPPPTFELWIGTNDKLNAQGRTGN